MTKLLFRGRTQAEDRAIRAYLHQQGVAVDPSAASVDASALEKAGVDVGQLARSAATRGVRDGFDLTALQRATVAPSAALLEREGRELSALAQHNLLASVSTSIERLGAERARLEAGEVPSRAEFTQLAAKLGSVNQQLLELTHGKAAPMAHWDAATFDRVRGDVQALLAEVARFGERAGVYVAEQGGTHREAAERLQKGVAELNRAIHVVARDVGAFVDRGERLAQDMTRLRARAVKEAAALGHDEAWLDAHFELTTRPDPRSENTQKAGLVTRRPLDLDWSNRGSKHLLGGLGAWHEHTGHLNASGNELASPWGLPAHVKGNLDLSRNAFEDLRAFDLRPIRVDGDVDLSHNTNLRELGLIHHLDVGGDLILVGIPATYFRNAWDQKPKVGGKIVLHPSQEDLIDECRYYQLPYRLIEDPSFKPFAMPSDPMAWLAGLTWDEFPKERDLLAVLKSVNLFGDPAVRASLSKQLVPRCLDADPNVARAAIALLSGRVDSDAAEALAMDLAARIPSDPRAPAGADLHKASAPLLGLALREISISELKADPVENKAKGESRYPSWGTPSPKTERIALELVRRAESGEPVPLSALRGQLESEVDRAQDGDTVLPEAAVRVVAAQLSHVSTVKGELRLHTKSGESLTLQEALGEVKAYSSTWDAFERALRRNPHDAPLAQLYDVLKTPGLSSVVYVGADDRAERFQAELAARRAPSPALAGALAEARALSRHSQPKDVAKALDRLVAGAPKLDPIERVAVLQELITADVHELRHHASNDVRVAWTRAAGALVTQVPPGQGELVAQVLERFLEQFTNAPAAADAAGLARGLVDVLHAIPSGSSRGYFAALHARALDKSEPGRAALSTFFDETIARAGDASRSDAERHEDFVALGRVTGCLIPVITKARTAEVAAGLEGLALEGDLAFDRDQLVAKLAK